MPVAATRQLELIGTVHWLLSEAAVPHWLAGGWGIDFLLGRVTREHGDIDFAIWLQDYRRVESILAAHGFSPRENEFPDETLRLATGEQRFEFYLLQRRPDNATVVGGRWADWPFPENSFGRLTAQLGDVTCPVLSAEGQLDSKERWPEHAFGAPLRQKDIRDIALLREYVTRKAHTG